MKLTAITVRGPFRGLSGYDNHVRQLVRQMVKSGLEIHLTDIPDWGSPSLPAGELDPLFDSLDRPVDSPLLLQFCMPDQLRLEPGVTNVNYTMFEATRIPKHWAEIGRRCPLTIVPTESSRLAWRKSGVPARQLRLSPLGVDVARFNGLAEPSVIRLEDGSSFAQFRHRFLNVAASDRRKNLSELLKTWREATSPTDNAALVVKVSFRALEKDAANATRLSIIRQSLREKAAGGAPVGFIFDHINDEAMPTLYSAATHYISLSHGEGWDLSMTEAIASGLIPIAPDHSAYQSYLDGSTAHLIPSKVGPAENALKVSHEHNFRGLDWWYPDTAAAAQVVRSILDHEIRPEHSATDHIRDEYSWERSTERLIKVLEAFLEEQHGSRRFGLRWRRNV